MKYYSLFLTSTSAVLQNFNSEVVGFRNLGVSENPNSLPNWAGELAESINLTDNEKQEIVKLHNKWRSDAAKGLLHQNLKARAMETIQWDDELADSAKAYGDYCNYQHSHVDGVDYTTLNYEYGENLFITSELNTTYAIQRSSNGWGEEHQDYDHLELKCEGNMCGHYTQMVWEKTTRMGCSLSKCNRFNNRDYKQPGLFLVCHYYPMGNFNGIKPYTYVDESENETTGDLCKHGVDTNTGLCQASDSICTEEQTRLESPVFKYHRCQSESTCITESDSAYSCLCNDKFKGKWCEQSKCSVEKIENTGLERNFALRNQLLNDNNTPKAYFDQNSSNHPKLNVGLRDCLINDACAGLVRIEYQPDLWVWLAVKDIGQEGGSMRITNIDMEIQFHNCDNMTQSEQENQVESKKEVEVALESEVIGDDISTKINFQEDSISNSTEARNTTTEASTLTIVVDNFNQQESSNKENSNDAEQQKLSLENTQVSTSSKSTQSPTTSKNEVVSAIIEASTTSTSVIEPVDSTNFNNLDPVSDSERSEEDEKLPQPACSCSNGFATKLCSNKLENSCGKCNSGYKLVKKDCVRMNFMERFRQRFETFVFRLKNISDYI